MSPEHGDGPGVLDRRWSAKVLELGAGLEHAGIPHAFGGAIAMNYHREPRATLDIDVNVFLTEGAEDAGLRALAGVYEIADPVRLRDEIARTGQARTLWEGTYVDLFFANTDFHLSMSRRVDSQPFADGRIMVLSIEDLLVCKAIFDRPKDWVDIEAVVRTKVGDLDYDYMTHWLGQFVSADDPRWDRLDALPRGPR